MDICQKKFFEEQQDEIMKSWESIRTLKGPIKLKSYAAFSVIFLNPLIKR